LVEVFIAVCVAVLADDEIQIATGTLKFHFRLHKSTSSNDFHFDLERRTILQIVQLGCKIVFILVACSD